MPSPADLQQLTEWRKTGAHLPAFLRDFHAQKDVFKYIDHLTSKRDEDHQTNWCDAQIYVIDAFLWCMARHGFTLQRCRAKQPFDNLDEGIEAHKKLEREAFATFLEKRQP